MPVPSVTTNIANGAPATVDTQIPSRCAVIGYSSSGALTTKLFSRRADAITEFVEGPLVRAGVHCIDTAKREVIFQRCEASNPGAYDTINNAGFTGTAVPTVVASVVPRNECELYIAIEDGGVPTVDGITYRQSTADGRIDLSGLRRLGTGTRFSFGSVNSEIELNPPTGTLIAIATEFRADSLAHFANAVAHNAADVAAAALITLPVPTTDDEAYAVINQCVTAWAVHIANDTVHDSRDIFNVVSAPVATTRQAGVTRGIEFKADFNSHLAATFPADVDSLLVATATTTAVQTYLAASLIVAGVTQLDRYPSYITFTTGGGTPADAPASVTITGTNADTNFADSEIVNLSQIAGTATATKRFLGAGLSIAYAAGDGTGATISIGTTAAAHNSADVTNTISTADPSHGTVVAGDIIRCQTFAPYPSTAELAVAFETLALSDKTPGFVLLAGRTPASYAATISAGLNLLKDPNGKPVRCMVQARRRQIADLTAQGFRDNLESETSNVADTRIVWVSTDALCTTSEGSTRIVPAERFTGFAINLAASRIQIPFWETTWQVGKGNLPGVRLIDNDGVVVGWDEPRGIETRLQLLYQVPNAELGRPTVAAPDYTLAGEAEDLKTMQAGLVQDEIVRVLEAYHWTLVGLTQKIKITSPGFGVFADDPQRQSIQRTAAARLRARPGLQQGISDIDRADFVSLAKEVTIVQGTIRVEFTVKWTPTYPIGEVITTISVDTGVPT